MISEVFTVAIPYQTVRRFLTIDKSVLKQTLDELLVKYSNKHKTSSRSTIVISIMNQDCHRRFREIMLKIESGGHIRSSQFSAVLGEIIEDLLHG